MSEKPPGYPEGPHPSAPADPGARAIADRIVAHDPAAEAALVARYRRGLILVLRRWGADPTNAEDIAHETLIVVIERLRQRALDEPEKLDAFVRGVAHNLMVTGFRAQRRRRTNNVGELIDEFVDPRASPADEAIRSQEARAVRRLIEEMTVTRDRELLRRHYIFGESKAQICSALEMDEAHFNKILHRARQRLGALLADRGIGKL